LRAGATALSPKRGVPMRYVLAVWVVLTLAVTALGQQGGDGPCAAAAATCEPQPNPIGQRLEQLRRTAGELEHAGKMEEAAAIHQQVEQERAALLGRLDALEAEAEQIRQAIGAGTQVLVHVQVVEVPTAKLRALGFDFQRICGSGRSDFPFPPPANDQTPGSARVSSFISGSTVAQGLVDALREDKLLKVLAEPTLVTLSGRTAVFETGVVPVPKPQPDGSATIEHQSATMVQLTPEVLGNRVRLAVHGRVTEPDPAHSVRVGNQSVPGAQSLGFDMPRTEMNSGETVVLGGLISRVRTGETSNETATYVLVRAEIVPPLATASRAAVLDVQGRVPTATGVGPAVVPSSVPAATARRSPDDGVRR
jgi:hypothetical protein